MSSFFSSFLDQKDELLRRFMSWFFDLPKDLKNDKKTALFKLVIITGAVSFTYNISNKLYRKSQGYPPGPIGVPIFGALANYYLNPVQFLTDLGAYYGPVSFFYFGERPCVSLNTAEICREVYKKKQYLPRPEFPKDLFQLTILANANGELWNVRRKLINASLLRLMDRSYVSEVVRDTLEKYTYPDMDKCEKNETLWYPREFCAHIAWSTIYYTAFGEKLDMENPIYQKIRQTHEDFSSIVRRSISMYFLPLLRLVWPSTIPRAQEIEKSFAAAYLEILTNYLERKKNKDDEEFETRKIGFVNDMLAECNEGGAFKSLREVAIEIGGIHEAGNDGTADSMEMALVFAAKYPEKVQQRVYAELKGLFPGKNENFELAKYDMREMPLFQALVYEALRLSHSTQFGVFHYTNENDVIECGPDKKYKYKIPANTVVFINNWYCMEYSREEGWLDPPNEFYLENWLTTDSTTNKTVFKMKDPWVRFGIGRRDCVGRELAMKQLMTTIGNILLRYELKLEPKYLGGKNDFSYASNGLTYKLTPQVGILVKKRNK